MSLVGQGAVALARRVGGLKALNSLLGGKSIGLYREHINKPKTAASSSWSLMPPFDYFITFYNGAFNGDSYFTRGTAVHELAHIIDLKLRFLALRSALLFFPSLANHFGSCCVLRSFSLGL